MIFAYTIIKAFGWFVGGTYTALTGPQNAPAWLVNLGIVLLAPLAAWAVARALDRHARR